MVRKMGNYIYVPRSIFEDESLDDARFSRREAFLYLVQRATYEQEKNVAVKGGIMTLKRGQLIFSLRKLADKWGWGKDKVAKTLADFESERRIDILKDSLFSVISIVNYDLYQGCADTTTHIDADTTADTNKDADKDTNKDGIKNNKEEKERKEIKKDAKASKEKDDAVTRLYSLYPTKCPVSGRATGKGSKDKMKLASLMKSGHTEEELSSIISRYIKESIEQNSYIKNFQTFLNNLPDYSQQLPLPLIAPAPSPELPPIEEALEKAKNPTKEETAKFWREKVHPFFPRKDGESEDDYRERVRPIYQAQLKEWIEDRVFRTKQKYL